MSRKSSRTKLYDKALKWRRYSTPRLRELQRKYDGGWHERRRVRRRRRMRLALYLIAVAATTIVVFTAAGGSR